MVNAPRGFMQSAAATWVRSNDRFADHGQANCQVLCWRTHSKRAPHHPYPHPFPVSRRGAMLPGGAPIRKAARVSSLLDIVEQMPPMAVATFQLWVRNASKYRGDVGCSAPLRRSGAVSNVSHFVMLRRPYPVRRAMSEQVRPSLLKACTVSNTSLRDCRCARRS